MFKNLILALALSLTTGCTSGDKEECNADVYGTEVCPPENTEPSTPPDTATSPPETDDTATPPPDTETPPTETGTPPDTGTPPEPDNDGDGWTESEGDCDDADPAVHPGATELCDGIDNDCNGTIDGEIPTWYLDSDGDSYGNVNVSITDCQAPTGFVANATDCDDSDANVNPGATEVPYNGSDDDCDSGTPDDDLDGDGFNNAVDCDDTEAAINPDATEVVDGEDNDCDGNIDEGSSVFDDDGDGYSEEDGDCDDGDDSINPGATEVCDDVDQDCDGVADNNATDAATWYADADGDGFGDPDANQDACDQPSGYVADDTDCDDGEATTYPGATEVENDGVDQDCDGSDLVGLTSQECWDSIAFEIQNYAIDWSVATTTSTDWSGELDWVDTDPVQMLDAYTSTNLVTMWDQDYGGCSGGVLETSIYLPDGYTFPDLGDQYNNGIVVALQPDGTVYEVNYLEDCGDGTWAGYVLPDSSPLDACDNGIDSSRYLGAHGGSHITATQALREGELTGSSMIGRPLPVEVDHTHLYYDSSESDGNAGFRWPAASADWAASSLYSDSIADLQMGSILVLPESYDCTVMSTTPGERLCEVARDHGFVIVDDSYGEEEVAFPIEPAAQDEAEASLGYSLHDSQSSNFGGDVEDMFADIRVLTNPEAAWVQ